MARTFVMGIVNVTPDSFSDGGRWDAPDAAVAHARRLLADGADIVDIGGESTRPGAERVDERTELDRVLPVVGALADAGATVSVDTTRSGVAAECLRAGAAWINDVSGGLADPALLGVVAGAGAGLVTMHWRGHSREMAAKAVYGDVVAEVAAELASCRDRALAAGVDPARLVLDPGIGFAKTAEHNWAVLRHWDAFEALGHPLLLAVSRKRFLGSLLGDEDDPRPPGERDAATAALTALFAARGVWGVRVHDVRSSADAIAAADAMRVRRAGDEVVRITLAGIAATGHHGVFASERRDGQEFVVDVALDVRRPADSDALADTVDYGELAAAVARDIQKDPVDLIETLAGRIARTCLARPRVESATVTVHKPHAPMPVPVADASVTLTRRKST